MARATTTAAHTADDTTASAAPHLVLASASPRRQTLLRTLGLPFSIQTSDIEERGAMPPAPAAIGAALPPCPVPQDDHPALRAWRKVADIEQNYLAADSSKSAHRGEVVLLGADTVVVLAGQVLNKPVDAAHAREMLAQLAGQTHTVYTGLCVSARRFATQPPATPYLAGAYVFDLVASAVTLAPLRAAAIAAYVATGEPLDKAGAYGIQGLGGQLVQDVVGSYTNVVGLPLPITWQLLALAGLPPPRSPEAAFQDWLEAHRKEPLSWPSTQP